METFIVTDFGALGDGVTNDAVPIQAAIDDCYQAGGGVVIMPAGLTFKSGSLRLRSHVQLHVEAGARLTASENIDDFTIRRTTSGLSDGTVRDDSEPSAIFIAADDCENISITGGGIIDGGGRHYVVADHGPIYEMAHLRPYTIFLRSCLRVQIRDVNLHDAAYWTVRVSGCSDVLIDAVTIRNDPRLPNSDGIDVDTCTGVRISGCDISTGDDGICVKACQESLEFGSCEDIVVTGCTIASTSAALSIGSEIARPISNCIFRRCVVTASNRGIALKLSEGGGVSNVEFSDIVIESRFFDRRWWGNGEPIYISAYPWRSDGGFARNIRLRNILARSENGVLIRSERENYIHGVVMENVRVELDRWSGHDGGHWDLRPHSDGLSEHPTSGIHLERLSDVAMRHCEVIWAQPHGRRSSDFASALTVLEVPNLRLHEFRGRSADPNAWPDVAVSEAPSR